MSVHKDQLRDLVSDTLKEIGLHSIHAENLVLGTIAQESASGKYLKQLGTGPALGICQMEPATYRDHIVNYLKYKKGLVNSIKEACNLDHFLDQSLIYNLKFSICMCRVHYRRVKATLPTDLSGYAKYWKDHYNTHLGAGTTEEFIHNYKKYVL